MTVACNNNMRIKIVRSPLSKGELEAFLGNPFSDMIKFVVDIRRALLALGGELHSDAEATLLQDGSLQNDLWGGNYYPNLAQERRIDLISLINIRPSSGNPSLMIENSEIKEAVLKIVKDLIG